MAKKLRRAVKYYDARDFEYTGKAVMDNGERKRGKLRLETLGAEYLHFATEDGGHSFLLGSLMRGGCCDGWLRPLDGKVKRPTKSTKRRGK